LVAPGDCGAAIVIDRDVLRRGGAQAIYSETIEGGERAFRAVATRPELRRPWMPPLPDQ
jgi:hypothetical protein